MTGWPAKPVIYEINTAIWLGDLSRAAGRRVTLADVPASAWDDVTPAGADAVWLMGVWERSPAGLELANANAGLQASFRDALPDVRSDDVIGSPYCVRRYVVDDSFGGPRALAEARATLAARGVRLLLDYVPNHVAPDHPWVTTHPELFVNGGEADIEAEPAAWVRAAGHILAHGRDPYFPPWPDVVQLDAFSPALRAATMQTLSDIAGQCDGIRCDMAMLMTNQVFAKTWGGRTGQEPDEEFWPTVIAGLRSQHPETVLVAEAYWDMEWTLQQQGFDFCYDKRLYDRIVSRDVAGVRGHLRADLAYQSGSAGPTCTGAAGTSPTCSMTGYTSGAATSWLTRGCSSPCRPGAAICSPCRDPRPRGRNGIGAGSWSLAGLLDWSCSGLRLT